jgi:hypothetical protein
MKLILTLMLGLWLARGAVTLPAAGNPWQQVVVIGASASAGFVLSEPLGGTNTDRCQLRQYLDAAITAPHAPVENLASATLFLNPDTIAPFQVSLATNRHPTLVIGVDFLFWFCYGNGRTDEDRARHFETGLKLLEAIPVPVIVGDIPDVSFATNTGIISPAQVPSEAARAAANRRLHEWAARHPQITIVPLAKFMQAARHNAAITIHEQIVPAGKTHRWLQADALHPSPIGAAMLSLGILDNLVTTQKTFPARDICWQAETVLNHGLAATPH